MKTGTLQISQVRIQQKGLPVVSLSGKGSSTLIPVWQVI
jgi:hypothetical protein